MGLRVLLVDDYVGLQLVVPSNDGKYTKGIRRSVESYFTRHGFIVPLSEIGLSLSDVLDNKVPSFILKHQTTPSNHFLLTHDASMFQVDVYFPGEGGKLEMDGHSIAYGQGLRTAVGNTVMHNELACAVLDSVEDRETIGKELINISTSNGFPFVWMSVKEIQDKLHQLYPLTQEELPQ